MYPQRRSRKIRAICYPTQASRTPITSSDIAEIYIGLGHENQVFEWLEKAYEERARTLVMLKVEPEVESRACRSLPKLASI